MSSNKELIRAWYKWQRSDLPVANFRLRRVNTPTYRIEHDLDHQASYLHSLGADAIGKKSGNYAKRVSEELVELERISAELKACELPENEVKVFSQYIEATRSLLVELIRASSTNDV